MKYLDKNAIEGVDLGTRGIELASRFFWDIGLSAIESRFPAYIDRLAAGLVAAGSDCIGDDCSQKQELVSRFHIYLDSADYAEIGTGLQSLLDTLPCESGGVPCCASGSRINRVFSIDGFFQEKTSTDSSPGFSHAPESQSDWLKIPEYRLYDIAQGQVFYDPIGEFTSRRQGFAGYYPRDIWLAKTAAAMVECGEYGEVLLPKSLAQNDYFTAEMAWWRFTESVLRLGFLLNRKYTPSQQLLYREFCKLPAFSFSVTNLLWDGQGDVVRRPEIAKQIASIFISSSLEQGLVFGGKDSLSSFSLVAERILLAITRPDATAENRKLGW